MGVEQAGTDTSLASPLRVQPWGNILPSRLSDAMERQKRDCIAMEGHNVGLHDIQRTTKKDKLSCVSSLHATACMARVLAEEHSATPRDGRTLRN